MSDVTTVTVDAATIGTIRSAALEAPTRLLWLVDREARPGEETLAALMRHAPGPAASLPVDLQGDTVVALMGRIVEWDSPAILDAVGQHRLPLRHAHVCSLLVERDLVAELDPPDPARFGWYAGREWTARLFARRPGWLVPASRVTVESRAAGSPVHALRAARRGSWRAGETVRELQRCLMESAS